MAESLDEELEGEHRAQSSLMFALERFPLLNDVLPDCASLRPFSHGFGWGDGYASHPELVEREWLMSRGGRLFCKAGDGLPDPFFALATRNAGGSEYLIVMWKADGRRFHFHEQYVNFHAAEDQYESTNVSLARCLQKWERGRRDVLWSLGSERSAPIRIRE